MNTYARVVDGVVAEVFTPPEGVGIEACFHEDVAAEFVAAPSGVQPNWTCKGGVYAAPIAGAESAP